MAVLNFTVTNKFNNLNINANGTDVGPLSDKQPVEPLSGDTSPVPRMVLQIKDLKRVVKKSQIIPSIGINSDIQYDIVIKQEIPNEKWVLEFHEVKSSKKISTQSDGTNKKTESVNPTGDKIYMAAASNNTVVNVTVPPDEPPTDPSVNTRKVSAGAISAATTVYLVLFVIFMYVFGGSETAMDIFAIILLIVDIIAFVLYQKIKMENSAESQGTKQTS